MKASKILKNLIALNEVSQTSYEHPMMVKMEGKFYDLQEKVSIEFVNGEPSYVLHILND